MEFDRVFSSGKKVTHHGISAWLLPAPQTRLGFAISKKYGNNVRRNQFKRKVRAAFRQLYDRLPAADMVVSTSLNKGKVDYRDIEALFRILIKYETAHEQKTSS